MVMTVVSRRANQGLVIGDLHVTVLFIGHDHVRLAFESPLRTPSYWEQTIFLSAGDADDELELEPLELLEA